MRKAIKGIAELSSVLLVLFGLIVCMCETVDLDKQLMMVFIGAGIMSIGAVIGLLEKGEEDVYSR